MSSSPRHIQKPVQNDNGDAPTLRSRVANYFKSAIASRLAARAISWALKNTGLSPLTEGIRGAHTSDSDPNIRRAGSEEKAVPLALMTASDRLAHMERVLEPEAGNSNSIKLHPLEILQAQEHVMGLPMDMIDYLFASMPTSEEIEAARNHPAGFEENLMQLNAPRPYNPVDLHLDLADSLLIFLSRQSKGRGMN